MFFKNYTKPGKGINKEDLDKSGVELYFDILFRRIWKMIRLNLLYTLVSIPAIIVAVVASLYFVTMMASFKGIDINENAASLLVLSVLFAVIFFQITGSGPASVAKNYVLRRYVNDTHSWVVSDFFENIKKNFKQGIVVYIINALVTAVLLFAFLFYSFIFKNALSEALTVVVVMIFVIFAMMQIYVYQLVASVDLKVKHIYKNALALTIIKLPWNILVTIMTGVFICLVYYIALSIPLLCIACILVIHFVIVTFTQIFMTNNFIEKYVLEPGRQMSEDKE